MLALGVATQANELFLKDEAPVAPHKREGTEKKKPREKATDDISDGIYDYNIGDILSSFGITQFTCSNPIGFTDTAFTAAELAGTWYQAYASRSTDVYGCLSYTIVDDEETSGDLPAITINAGWSAFNTYWNPLQKGEYTASYELYGDTNGRLFERSLVTRKNTFSYIIASDYSTYFVEYSCK